MTDEKIREQFDLMATRLEAAKRCAFERMDRELFSDAADLLRTPLPPLTWHERYRRRLVRVSQYVSTLWKAVRGVELEEASDFYD